MKSFILKIKTYFENRKKGLGEKKPHAESYRDWVVLCVVGILSLIGISSFCIYLFFMVDKGGFFGVATPINSQQRGFDENKMISALEDLKKKEELYQQRLKESSFISDPSL
jgi:hypothetical protein